MSLDAWFNSRPTGTVSYTIPAEVRAAQANLRRYGLASNGLSRTVYADTHGVGATTPEGVLASVTGFGNGRYYSSSYRVGSYQSGLYDENVLSPSIVHRISSSNMLYPRLSDATTARITGSTNNFFNPSVLSATNPIAALPQGNASPILAALNQIANNTAPLRTVLGGRPGVAPAFIPPAAAVQTNPNLIMPAYTGFGGAGGLGIPAFIPPGTTLPGDTPLPGGGGGAGGGGIRGGGGNAGGGGVAAAGGAGVGWRPL